MALGVRSSARGKSEGKQSCVHACNGVKSTHRLTDRQTDKQTDRQTDQPTDRPTDRQTDQSSVKEAALPEGLGGPLVQWPTFLVERRISSEGPVQKETSESMFHFPVSSYWTALFFDFF